MITASNAVALPIELCNNFMVDTKFANVRETLTKPGPGNEWPGVLQDLRKPSVYAFNVSSEKDSVFFLADRFELVVDARGYSPTDIRCTVTQNCVQVVGQKVEKYPTPAGMTEQTRILNRKYNLPQIVSPELGSCRLSNEGILVVTAPWKK